MKGTHMTQTNPQDRQFGDAVNPATQTREDDGNRTLALPTQDPGPALMPGQPAVKHPDKLNDEKTLSDANPDFHVKVLQRTSTEGHGGKNFSRVELPPEHFVNGAASDMYNPEGREEGSALTDQAMRNAREQARVASPHRDTEKPTDDAPNT